jgi:hypothetical protein
MRFQRKGTLAVSTDLIWDWRELKTYQIVHCRLFSNHKVHKMNAVGG